MTHESRPGASTPGHRQAAPVVRLDARTLGSLLRLLGFEHPTKVQMSALVVPGRVLLYLDHFEVQLPLPHALAQPGVRLGDILEIRLHGLVEEILMIGDASSLSSTRSTSETSSSSSATSITAPSASARVEAITSNVQTQANARVLQVGQTLSARIIEVGNQEVRLQVGNQTLRASLPPGLSSADLRPGQPVQIQVLSLGNPPLIRLMLPTEEDSAQAQLMRLSLPRQSGMNNLFEHLHQLLSGGQEGNTKPERLLLQVIQLLGPLQADAKVRQALGQLVQQLANQHTSPQMQQALNQVAQHLASPHTSPSGNSQLQQAIKEVAQLLTQQSQSGTQPQQGLAQPTQSPDTQAPLAQHDRGQLQQKLSQLLQQIASQTTSGTPSNATQIQQALRQLAQQLGPQSPGSSPSSNQQLQETVKEVARQTGQPDIKQPAAQIRVQTQIQPPVQVQAQPQTQPQIQPQPNQISAQIAAAQTTQQTKELEEVLRLLNEHSLGEKKLGPELLRGLFLGSGLFLEAGLAHSRTPRANDLKSLLLRMVTILQSANQQGAVHQLLQRFAARSQAAQQQGTQESLQSQALHQLRKATEGALAKLELQQLQSLPPKGDESRQSWHFALTLNEEARFQEVEARIEREKSRKHQQDEDRWNVELHFDFEASGPVDARIQLQHKCIQVNFWASRRQTLERIKTLLPRLESALTKAGLEVGLLAAWPGAQPKAKDADPPPATNLLNLRA